jgi:predicted MFS family arabinose efflux permease
MSSPDSRAGKAVLTLAHVAGMVDMVALPLWIGALMQHYGDSPAQAGLTVTLFLAGAVAASAFFAPRFNRWPRRALAGGGFAVAALAFALASQQTVAPSSFAALAALHALAGLGVGCALSFTHGAIGRSANPHRLFAVVNIALGVFAVVFLASMPQVIAAAGAATFFGALALLMALAAVTVELFFPDVRAHTAEAQAAAAVARVPGAAWLVIGVIICLTMNQAMVFSFLERIGAERNFGADRVNGVLIALGFVNLLPGVLAAVLQKRWSPLAVGVAGPLGQALLALTMSSASTFWPYAVAASLYVSMVIFTHTFLFGLLTRLDGTGRAAAATPAMMMLGACVGPALGGAVVQGLGYPGLGYVACGIAFVAVLGMALVRRSLAERVVLSAGSAGAAHLATKG